MKDEVEKPLSHKVSERIRKSLLASDFSFRLFVGSIGKIYKLDQMGLCAGFDYNMIISILKNISLFIIYF